MNVPVGQGAQDRPDDPELRQEPADRRTLDAVFGTVLPDTTRDERGAGEDHHAAFDDEWYRAERPPHHDG